MTTRRFAVLCLSVSILALSRPARGQEADFDLLRPAPRIDRGKDDPVTRDTAVDESAVDESAVDESAVDESAFAIPSIEEGVGVADEAESSRPSMDLLSLLMKGRWLMVPIAIMSVIVVMLVFERSFALRRSRVIPEPLLDGLADLGGVPGVMDPRRAYRLCQERPSATAIVVRAMLLKIGRPHAEVEHAVAEASEREAERLYANVRWLNLIAAVAPLTGLLGTVWGMIRAFYDTTHLVAGQNKADFLAQGIYVALVTTLGGLVVAIPAAIFAHYFEGRIIKLFHEIDELLFNLMPQIERYEGRMRVTPHTLGSVDDPAEEPVTDDSLPPADPPRRGSARVI